MALNYADRVKETTTSHSGTGTVTLNGAVVGFRTFGEIGNANTCVYLIEGATAGEWEVGIGTYTSSGTTLSRDTVLSSSNSGSKTDFTSGSHTVSNVMPGSHLQTLDDFRQGVGFFSEGLSADKSCASATYTAITGWNTPEWDVGSGFSSDVWTAPMVGRYLFHFGGILENLDDGNRFIMRVTRSEDGGSTFPNTQFEAARIYSAVANAWVGTSGSQLGEVTNTSHQFRLEVYQDNGAALDFNASNARFGATFLGGQV